ncbi:MULTISPECIES: 23S rRNA (adenine(2503)-C(2))-methyltransferase RlmN [unclassified Prochlorococcus]|uniref:23S rRNA (adenine(2503)-C(2))-methyltransferase RlmN n=1 Tax=unclassified Prochlorococcus TaxID=2627481 RepID=UPI0005339923|nr:MULTISPECIES: 23S rRNA (adenine(2503)-C(2))-methyltransferase RlmN [unclassified Prochlorococcus]KGG14756.1 Ribosomal RNA large subunit methyltransferase N [Prochlorococcus sp. MIT 0602]KGG15813.1 Ribosomal RNA large subunit methyltransferase N [Prochlorococcus sp. MIT 0603]
MESNTVDLLGLNLTQLENLAVDNGESSFRGRQLYQWLYQRGIRNIEDITVLPKSWRESLINKGFNVGALKEVNRLRSNDRTIKLLLSTSDNQTIETVGIPTEKRLTVCVSSQIGCSMSCKFCATGKGGLQRSLKVNEIVDQFFAVSTAFERRPSHVVFMGMGEPLLNVEAVLSSIRCINEDLGIGQRRITVSTVGVRNVLPQLGEKAIDLLGSAQFTLALSLHAPNQQLRQTLIPSANAYPIKSLMEDCQHYIDITGRRVSFEYILLGFLNDHIEHAEELADLVGGFQSHVNLIAYNPIDGETFKRPGNDRVRSFMQILEKRGIAVSLRRSRGLDKNAACGQLRRFNAEMS